MLSAIIGSTILEGSRTTFSTESTSVSVCASVKAETTFTKSQKVTAASASAEMKRR